MEHKEYNGWTNYETWVVKLWIDNEEGSYNYWREIAGEAAVSCTKLQAIRNVADALKEQHEEDAPEVQGVFADLISAAMSEVNWYEIAENMVEAYMADHPEEFTEQTERN
jgi:hypothetical protein